MDRSVEKSKWVKSSDARKIVKASTCDLSHMRQDGKIQYKKEGNSYLYKASDLQKIAKTDGHS